MKANPIQPIFPTFFLSFEVGFVVLFFQGASGLAEEKQKKILRALNRGSLRQTSLVRDSQTTMVISTDKVFRFRAGNANQK